MMEQSDLTLDDAAEDTWFRDMKEKEVRLHEGSGSDGYLVHVFRHTAKELFNEDVGVLTYCTLRNKDFQEVTLERHGEFCYALRLLTAFQTSRSGPEGVEGQVPLPLCGGPGLHQACLSGRGQAQAEDGCADRALLWQM
uniref:Uncharacterized protein n=1 Tax=Myotis myotis TaxID=51298 RepID=A0A7J7TTR2_MYOMY|nr:hypothetical protein mMyoMyo1_008982 [Myotis myotis]